VALFGTCGVYATADAFIEFAGLLKAGHATQLMGWTPPLLT